MYEVFFFVMLFVVGICLGDSVQFWVQGGVVYEWLLFNYLSLDMVVVFMVLLLVLIEYSCKIIFLDGCFIIDIVLVEVDQDIMVAVDIIICVNQDYYGYQILGMYMDVFMICYGCDSICVLQLLVLFNVFFVEEVCICEGESYWGFMVIGIYEDILFVFIGCDIFYWFLL